MLRRLLTVALLCGAVEGAGVDVTGSGFEIGELRDGVRAFGNRTYVWRDVPKEFVGWQFTRLRGGEPARLHAKAGGDGYVHAATNSPELPGWEKTELGFHYTDQKRTRVFVFRRQVGAGEGVDIVQRGWTGTVLLAPALTGKARTETDHSRVPGVVVDHSPARTGRYIGCPGIAVLEDGTYVATHSFFGPKSTGDRMCVHRSRDRGRTWTKAGEVRGQWWSTLFVHRGALYLMGVNRRYGHVAIRRSLDGGVTWTTPKDSRTGLLLADGRYHCAPVPVVVHGGRIWRAMEDAAGGGGWGKHFRAFVMSAPEDADLLDATAWIASNRLARDAAWLKGAFGGWLEGNVVVGPDDKLVNILRVHSLAGGRAATVRVSEDGRGVTFDPRKDFIEFPGGAKKFTIRRDGKTGTYWSLSNGIREEDRKKQKDSSLIRNTLALVSSRDLRTWTLRSEVLHHPDPVRHGFQYVDWLFEGADIIFVSRTAYDDGLGGAHRQHDANYLTFHRLVGFRDRSAGDGPLRIGD